MVKNMLVLVANTCLFVVMKHSFAAKSACQSVEPRTIKVLNRYVCNTERPDCATLLPVIAQNFGNFKDFQILNRNIYK